MWKHDGPDMLYCDGKAIYRVRPSDDGRIPLEIVIERKLLPDEKSIPDYWPTKYEC